MPGAGRQVPFRSSGLILIRLCEAAFDGFSGLVVEGSVTMNPMLIIIAGNGCLIESIAAPLAERGLAWTLASPGEPALKAIGRHRPALVMMDSGSDDDRRVLDRLAAVSARYPEIPVLLIARRSSEVLAIGALKRGVADYFKAPVETDDLMAGIDRLLAAHCRRPLQAGCDDRFAQKMVGRSRIMTDLRAQLERVSLVDSTVLITGETGTGKELAAELIHASSGRADKAMVNVNCAAVPDSLVESELFGHTRGAFTGAVAARAGRFEQARGGTVFLDEIGDMTPFAQAKILRVIEEKTIAPLGGGSSRSLDFRLVAATNRDPEALMAEGTFRNDLFYRLNVARVHMPSLREHRDDIPLIVDHCIRKLNRKFNRDIQGLRPEAIDLLYRYDWPGNVRELMNVLEGAYVNMPFEKIAYTDLPTYFKNKLIEYQHASSDERKRIISALLETNWNKSTAAKRLKWSRMTLYRKIEKYNIVEKRNSTRNDEM